MLKYLFTFLVLFAGTLAAQVGNQVTSQPPVTPGDCVQFVSQTRISDAGAPCGSGGGGAVSSVSNSDGTLTISPTTGAVIAGIALGHANSWTGTQTFTNLTVTGTCTGCGGGGGDTVTSPNATLNVTGTSSATGLDVLGAAGKILAGATPALTYTPTLGVQNVTAESGSLTINGGSAVNGLLTVNGTGSSPASTVISGGTVTAPTHNATTLTSAYQIGGVNFLIQPASDTSSIAIGPNAAGAQASTSLNNTVIGNDALEYVTSGFNVAIGSLAMQGVSGTPLTGINNVAVGYQAEAVIQGAAANNTAVGDAALSSLTTGAQNTAVGSQSMLSTLTGNYSSAFGFASAQNTTANYVTALGYQAFKFGSSGAGNTAIGAQALDGNTSVPTTGANNTAVGYLSLGSVQGAAASNTAIGYQAGYAGTALTTGSNNTFLGYQAKASTATDTNEIVISANAITGLGSNSVNLANVFQVTGTGTPSTSQTTIAGNLNFSTATNAGSGYVNLGFPGTNGTSKNIFEAVDQTSGQIFNCSVGSTVFNSVIDDVSTCGWNQRYAVQISNSWGSIFDQLEDSYVPGANQVLEHHMIVANTSGVDLRYFSSQFLSSTGVDQFADWNLNGGMAWQCLTTACLAGATSSPYMTINLTTGLTVGGGIGSGNLPITASGTVMANSNGNSGGGVVLNGSAFTTHFVGDTVPSNCTSLAYTVVYWANVPRICPTSSTAAPSILGTAAVNQMGYQTNSGFYANTATGTTAAALYRGASAAGAGDAGIGITSSYTSDTNMAAFLITPISNNSATMYAIGYNVGSGGPNPMTTLNLGGWTGVSLNLTDGSTNVYTGNGSGTGALNNGITATTQAASDSSTKLATTAFVKTQNYAAAIATPGGTPTYTAGTNVTSVVCATSYTCTNTRGELTIVGGTATTGTIATVNFSATLSAAPGLCLVTQEGGASVFGIGHGVPSTTSFTITSSVSVAASTVTIDYQCLP